MNDFGAQSTADEVLAGHDLTGQIVFVTGGYSGLGKETARAMAARGAEVILAGRDAAKLAEASGEIEQAAGQRPHTIVCDLASLASVRACAAEAKQRFERIDILINNAGVMACPLQHTADGFEMQFGTNHLGHFVLTLHLLPLIERGGSKRIVNLSSRAHHMDEVHFDDPNFERRAYDKWLSYGQSKTANVQFAVALDRRLKSRGIDVLAVHPGGIMTNLGRNLSEEDRAALMARVTASDRTFAWKTVEQGAATSCWAATARELAGNGGAYCEDCHVAAIDDRSADGGVRSYAVDAAKAEQLWALSEELVGESFAL